MDLDEIVRRHMCAVYEDIWEHFDVKRPRPWKEVVDFVDRCEGRTAVDIGSGNGRNAVVLADRGFDVVAVDRCVPLLRSTLSRERSGDGTLNLVQGDMVSLPLADSTFDVAIMVAGIHHFPTEEGRLRCLEEMRRVMAPGARGQVTSWGLHQERVPWEEMRTSIETEWGPVSLDDPRDRFVPWKEGGRVRWRYYHFFTERELRELSERVFGAARAFTSGDNVFVEVAREDGALK